MESDAGVLMIMGMISPSGDTPRIRVHVNAPTMLDRDGFRHGIAYITDPDHGRRRGLPRKQTDGRPGRTAGMMHQCQRITLMSLSPYVMTHRQRRCLSRRSLSPQSTSWPGLPA